MQLSNWLPPEEKAKKWKPQFYFGQDKMPLMTDVDIRKQLYKQKQERDVKKYLIAKETLFAVYEYEKAVRAGELQEIRKSLVDDGINDAVKRILRGRK